MPKKYLRLKKKFLKQGFPKSEAMEKAAKTYNAQRKKGQKPVSPYYHV